MLEKTLFPAEKITHQRMQAVSNEMLKDYLSDTLHIHRLALFMHHIDPYHMAQRVLIADLL